LKVLILGSNGLVGSSLFSVLSTKNDFEEVIPATRSNANLLDLQETSNLINSVKPNIIINAAARVGGVLANDLYRSQFLIENIRININLLESLIPFPKMKLINLGSSCIYPLNAENPIKEESIMTGKLEPTNSAYAMAKLTSIELGDSLSKQYGHQIVNLMPTNLYGPNDNFSDKGSHVIPGLIQRIHNAHTNNDSYVEVWGSGNPKREFLYVDDLASSILFIIRNGINVNLLNIGSGKEISISELVSLLVDVIQYKGDIKYSSEYPDGNPKKMIDSTKINKLGWKAETTLTEGLRKTYSWYLENVS
jgi:GDP-L-fucose synthase